MVFTLSIVLLNMVLLLVDGVLTKFYQLCIKSPLQFPSRRADYKRLKSHLTRNSRCFIPSLLVESPDVSEIRFNQLLENMVSTRQLSESYAE